MDYQLKVAVVGHYNCGKTTLIHRLCERSVPSEKYDDESRVPTIGVGFFAKKIDFFLDASSVQMQHSQLKVNLFVWDTNGSEKYLSLVKPYFRQNAFVVVVFDVTNRESFSQVDYWRKQVMDTDSETKWDELPLFCLVGCKGDKMIENCVSDKEIAEKATEWQCPWWKISCTESFHMSGTRTEYIAKLQPHSTRVEMMTNYQHFLRNAPMLPTEQAVTLFAEMTLRFHKLLKRHGTSMLSRTCCSLGKVEKDIISFDETNRDQKKKGFDIQKNSSSCC